MKLKRYKPSTIFFVIGAAAVFAIVEILIQVGLLNSFWNTILRLGAVMAILSLGLNLIYGFNGQFSLGQLGFYAIGAYTAADITFRWTQNHSADGLAVIFMSALFAGIAILLVMRLVRTMRGLDQLSAFTMYLVVVLVVVAAAVKIGQLIAEPVTLALNTLPENFSLSLVYFLAILLGGESAR